MRQGRTCWEKTEETRRGKEVKEGRRRGRQRGAGGNSLEAWPVWANKNQLSLGS